MLVPGGNAAPVPRWYDQRRLQVRRPDAEPVLGVGCAGAEPRRRRPRGRRRLVPGAGQRRRLPAAGVDHRRRRLPSGGAADARPPLPGTPTQPC